MRDSHYTTMFFIAISIGPVLSVAFGIKLIYIMNNACKHDSKIDCLNPENVESCAFCEFTNYTKCADTPFIIFICILLCCLIYQLVLEEMIIMKYVAYKENQGKIIKSKYS